MNNDMKIHNTVSIIFLFLICFLTGGCSGNAPAPSGPQQHSAHTTVRVLTIGTADSGGTMSLVGRAIAQVISNSDSSININISTSTGSSENVRSLMEGEVDLALVSGDIALAAVNAEDEFSKEPSKELRAIAAVYSSVSGWLAPSSLGLSYVHDLKGKRLGIGPRDSTTELSARVALETMGIYDTNTMLKSCGLGSGAQEIRNQSLDAVHAFAGLPVQGLYELAEAVPCTVLKYTEEELASILAENPFYYPEIIPAGSYRGQTEAVETFGIKCLLCVSAEMDDELVYELTDILYQGIPELKEMHGALSPIGESSFLCSGLPIRLHPGAERFYREQHLLPE